MRTFTISGIVGCGLLACASIVGAQTAQKSDQLLRFEETLVVKATPKAEDPLVKGEPSDYFLTFSTAVSIPGVTLAAGTYLFRFPSGTGTASSRCSSLTARPNTRCLRRPRYKIPRGTCSRTPRSYCGGRGKWVRPRRSRNCICLADRSDTNSFTRRRPRSTLRSFRRQGSVPHPRMIQKDSIVDPSSARRSPPFNLAGMLAEDVLNGDMPVPIGWSPIGLTRCWSTSGSSTNSAWGTFRVRR